MVIKVFCFFCNYLINPKTKFREYLFKNKYVKICMKCKPSSHKALKLKFRSAAIDCSICSKKVMYNNVIHCKLCNHLVHGKCTNLSLNEVIQIEKQPTEWFCSVCLENILPINAINLNEDEISEDEKNKNKSEFVKQCFTCTTNILNKKALH